MVHRGKRSIRSLARRFVLAMSFRDTQLAETVCRTSRADILEHLRSTMEGVNLHEVPDVEKGLVLSDSRGRGAFQT